MLGVTGAGVALVPEAPALLMPLELGVVAVAGGAEGVQVIDRSAFLVAPRGARLAITTGQAAARVAMAAFHEPLFAIVEATYGGLGLDRRRLEAWLAEGALLPRTVWVHELLHRYVFERHALCAPRNAASAFLETELLKEIYYLLRDREEGAERATILREHSAAVERAVAYVEAHLFQPVRVSALVRSARASESSLLRAFHRELGCTPAAYWRRRKLEAALELLRSGRRTIAEVAETVGYDNPTAFGHAFRLHFNRPPSAFLPKRPLRPAP